MRETNIKIVITFLAICLVAGIFGYYRPKTVSTEFVGKISNVTGKSMTVTGFYRVPANPALERVGAESNVNVKINGSTKLTKTILHYPTAEELRASGGRYEISKLRQEDVEGSIEDLKNGSVDAVFAHSRGNVYERTEFTASEIKYRVMVEPK